MHKRILPYTLYRIHVNMRNATSTVYRNTCINLHRDKDDSRQVAVKTEQAPRR